MSWNDVPSGADNSWNTGGDAEWKESGVSNDFDSGNAGGPVGEPSDNFVTDAGYGGGDAGAGGACRNCGQEGHFARECPEPKKMSGECFNCGQTGHNKAECPNPKVDRPFTGTCRLCNEEGHRAGDCPQKPPSVCKNCLKEGHQTSECTENRALDLSKYPDMSPEEAWAKVEQACQDRDLDDLKEAVMIYAKAYPALTFSELEDYFRSANNGIYIVALEQEVPDTLTIVNLQGKIDCKYTVTYSFSAQPKRMRAKEGWPETPEINTERLKDAGVRQDRRIPKCSNCDELGHIAKSCKQEKVERERVAVKCMNCQEIGHRQRDCPQARPDKFKCRNCNQSGHSAKDCTEPRSAEGVECKRCNEIGHFAKDCPNSGGRACRNCGEEGHMAKECEKPRNPDMVTCRNCEKTGHFSRDCPEPKDWSKVKCSNCGEMGHTIKRCKQPVADEYGSGDAVGGQDDNAGTNDTYGGMNDTSGGAVSGVNGWETGGASGGSDWEKPAATAAAGGWDSGATNGSTW